MEISPITGLNLRVSVLMKQETYTVINHGVHMMQLDLDDSKIRPFWDFIKKTRFADEFKEQLPQVHIMEHFTGEFGVATYIPGETSVTVNNVSIPNAVLRDINATVEAWDIVTETIQALELKGYEAHRFFKFPEFIVSSGIIYLDKDHFVMRKPIGSHVPLFKINEVNKIFRLTK